MDFAGAPVGQRVGTPLLWGFFESRASTALRVRKNTPKLRSFELYYCESFKYLKNKTASRTHSPTGVVTSFHTCLPPPPSGLFILKDFSVNPQNGQSCPQGPWAASGASVAVRTGGPGRPVEGRGGRVVPWCVPWGLLLKWPQYCCLI